MMKVTRVSRQAGFGCFSARLAAVGFLVFAVLMAGGCAVGPNYVPPSAPEAPEEWMGIGEAGLITGEPDYRDWWTVFNDPVLDSLVANAYAQNLTLRVAGIRVLEARSQRLIAIGSFFPQTQQATAGYSRNLASKNLHPAAGMSSIDLGSVSRTYNLWTTGFDALWELDIWGRFRRAIESATDELEASIENYDDVLVTLVAEVAATYVQVRAFEQRLEVTRENVELQKRTLGLTEKRFKYGAVSELDVEQAKYNLTNTQAMVPPLETGLQQSQNALCTLLGIPPRDMRDILGAPKPVPAAPAEVAVGIPADLLRRRPDVRRAEREVAAQSALIGAAVSDLYPHVILKGSIGVEADDFSDMWQDMSLAGAVGPSVQWDILNYGRIVNRVNLRNALTEEAIVNYQNTVLKAYEEAENVIVAYLRSQERAKFLFESVRAAKRSVDISLIQYRDGVTDFIRVLNSQTFLTRQQNNLIVSREDIARNLIALHKALGGGWEIRLGKKFVPAETEESMRSRFGWTTGWWPRLSLGWPFSGRDRKHDVIAAEPDTQKDDHPGGDSTGAGGEGKRKQSTAEKFADISLERIPVRINRPESDAE